MAPDRLVPTSPPAAPLARRLLASLRRRVPRPRRADLPAFLRRLVHVWLVWSALLLVHEAGHAILARWQGMEVHRLTVGAGPVVWRGEHDGTKIVLRLVPLAGVTAISEAPPEPGAAHVPTHDWRGWGRHTLAIAGGVLATLGAAVIMAGLVAGRERRTHRRWTWGRIVVADALVLTVFNFLPVPPLDGGRIVAEAVAAMRGAPLSGDALFWVQLGGLALAVLPMTLWTRWTARIDRFVLSWRVPQVTSIVSGSTIKS